MLSYTDFQDYVKQSLSAAMPDADISIKEKLCNNGTKESGICISLPDSNISPYIHLDESYSKYTQGTDLNSVTEELVQLAQQNINPPDAVYNIKNDFFNFEKIADKIVMQAINYDKNPELLSQIPFTPKEDLALIYKVVITDFPDTKPATITIKNEYLEAWGKTTNEIHDLAEKNTPKIFPATINSMSEIMKQLYEYDGLPKEVADLMLEGLSVEPQMYIISNDLKTNGAATMFYDNVLSSLSEKVGTDLYVFPSSIHEVIAISTDSGVPEEFADMVKEINNDAVAPKEQLSDNVYKFDAKTKELSIAAEPQQRIYRKCR